MPTIIHMLDSDALRAVLEHVQCDTHLALSLTCKAFHHELRLPGQHLSTSVTAMYTNPKTLARAIGIGCPSPRRISAPTAHAVIKMLGDREPHALTQH